MHLPGTCIFVTIQFAPERHDKIYFGNNKDFPCNNIN